MAPIRCSITPWCSLPDRVKPLFFCCAIHPTSPPLPARYLSHGLTPHPQLPPIHTHTWMHTGMRGEWHNPANAKTWCSRSALRSTAALMNGHSDARTKLRLGVYYTVGSGVSQSTDRSRNQRWMPGSHRVIGMPRITAVRTPCEAK